MGASSLGRSARVKKFKGEDGRRQHKQQQTQRVGGEGRQRLGINRAQGLGDNLGKDQDQQGQDRRDDAYKFTAENRRGFRAGAGGPDGVGDGVQGQDGRDGMFDILAQALHDKAGLAALLHQQFNMRHRRGQHGRFPDGTQKGDHQRDDDVDDQAAPFTSAGRRARPRRQNGNALNECVHLVLFICLPLNV